MRVIAQAHEDEVAAQRAGDRAMRRLQLLIYDGNTRRYLRAITSASEAFGVLHVARRRHSHWYRAYLHTRRSNQS